MKKLMLIIGVALMLGCAPGKSGNIVNVDIYCDSCKVKVSNSDGNEFIETTFNGDVSDYKRVVVDRYTSNQSCVRVIEFTNYDTTSTFIYYIENGDTIDVDANGIDGYCN
jgi:hypothetical protein